MKENKSVNFILKCIFVILGNFVYAAGVKFFLMPGDLISGGSIGIALLVNHYTGISISGFIFIFNLRFINCFSD